MDQALAEKLKLEHGDDLIQFECDEKTTLVFRKPKRAEFDRWFDKRDQGTAAARELAQSTLVHPGRDDFIAILEKIPGLLMGKAGILDGLIDLTGFGGSIVAKKL